MLISKRQEYTDEFGHSGEPAIRWFLNLYADGLVRWIAQGENKEMGEWLAGEHAKVMKKFGSPNKTVVFRIENDQLLSMLGLERREGLRYSIADLAQNQEKLRNFFDYARSAVQRQRKGEKLDLVEGKAVELFGNLTTHQELDTLGGVLMVPTDSSEWLTLGDAIASGQSRGNKAAESLQKIILAYATDHAKEFNKAVREYKQHLARTMPNESKMAGLEAWFNHFAPFYQCMCLYVLVFLLACLSWVSWPEILNRAALYLGIAVVIAHTFALCLRMYLQGRPPVTNLYSSAVFIGWGCVLLCLFIEYLFRNGLGSAGAAVTGFSTLIIAHHLAGSGDTLEMMQAVLDTNFWLATHVTTVTLGYAATFIAGLFGLIFVIRGVFTPSLDPTTRKTLAQIIYGVVCFATLLSFVGTVLGGIWADQSWGRFWGWDPKENGALLIVIMNALILHARWGGMIKDRGMAVLAMVGNMVTMWSWFGTNQLGIGLHSYGFNNALILMCSWFWITQLLFIGVGLVPLQYWRSFQTLPPVRPKETPSKAAPKPGPRGSTGIVPAG
jgi:ABC-type transport system involved in cytochrome c biogenesis permease subunit